MSVYTLLNQNQIEGLLTQYGITDIEKFSEISDGIKNSNYFIHAAGKEYVLTIFEHAASANLLPYLHFMAAAQAQGKAVPCPLVNSAGERLSYFNFKGQGKPFIVCERLLGSHPQQISLTLCEHLGEQVAGLHALRLPNDLLAQFPMHDLSSFILPLDFEKVLSDEKRGLFYKTQRLVNDLNHKAGELNLNKGVVHCDFFPDNALVNTVNGQEHIVAFLDWYDARYSYLLIDLAIIAVSWCTENFQLVKEKEFALLKGYQKVLPFNEHDFYLWNDFLKAAALFFWISREDYHATMRLQGRTDSINPKKNTDEFYKLLLNL